MTQAAVRIDHQVDAAEREVAAPKAAPMRAVTAHTPGSAVDSPAIALQQRIAEAYASDEPRWSGRRTLAFIGLTCGAFWACVGAAAFLIAG